MNRPPNRLVAFGCLALSMSLVGSYVALSKPLVAALPVFLLGWLRFGIGAIAMLGWLRKPREEPPLGARMRALLFLESFLGNFLFTVCMLYGVSLTSAVSAGVIMAAIPAAVALMSWAFLRERISARVWSAVACAAVGIGLLALSKQQHADGMPSGAGPAGDRAWLGNLLIVGAVLCEASYAVIGKRLTKALGPKRIASLINLWGFALMTPLGFYIALRFDFGAVPAGIWLLLVFYALAASVFSVWLWMTGLAGVPAALGGVFTVMLPISTALIGVLALGEHLVGMQLLAFAVALLGVLLATFPSRQQLRAARAARG
ncbi:MAG: Permease of the drug/metabolite transporter (DMT) superfamily [Burkholderiaceae bacterium]|jgi:drug/metabolite transporter (DMT)-like permease|nr:MAG: Permease of the drug/metabolite transporter (DMT) superfamily [Burkholderiaceae bacterium]